MVQVQKGGVPKQWQRPEKSLGTIYTHLAQAILAFAGVPNPSSLAEDFSLLVIFTPRLFFFGKRWT